MSSETYTRNARQVIADNFRHVSDVDSLKIRKTALKRCEDMGLEIVSKLVCRYFFPPRHTNLNGHSG